LNVTVEEQEAKVNDLRTAYQNLQSEYEQLSGKQDLTEAEKKRLSYLERRLELDERILKAEEHQLFEEKTGKKFTDRFDEDNYYTRYQKDTNGNKWDILSGIATFDRESYGYLSEVYSQKLAEIKAAEESIDAWTESSSHLEEGSDEWNLYQSSIETARNRQTEAIKKLSENEDQLIINLGGYSDVIGDLETYLDSGDLNDEDTKNAKELLRLYKARYEYTQLMIDSIQKLNGTYKENLTVLQQIDREYGGGYSDGTAADLNRTQEQKNFREFSHSLSIDDQEIVNSDAFKQALDQIREKADGAELSVTNYEEALRAAKGTQDALAEGDPVAVNDFNTSVYGLENYAIAKTAAAVAGADLNADINETAALLQAEGLMASDDAQQIMEYMLAKYAASGGTIGVDDTIFELAKEYDWLADLIDQWGLYYNVSKKGYGNTSGSKNLGVGNYTPAAVASPSRKKEKTDFPTLPNVKPTTGSAKTETNALSSLNSEMDKLQSSYKSLCDIRDTYNQNGKITIDQYQELTNMGFTFLSQLVDENGQLGLNASAFERLSQAKLQEMQIQMARNAADTINGLKTEAAAVEYLTYANEQLRDAALGAAEAQLAAAVDNANARGGKQAEAAQQIYQGYQAAKQMAGKVDFSFTPASSSASSPAAKAEPAKTETSSSPMDAYNKEKSLLEHMLAMDQISKAEYYEKLLALAKSSFAGDEEHQDQIWDAEESYHDYLESIKETYNWIEVFLENLSRKA
ncbi:MAG: hypothetical protein K2I53_09735, partial [Lachnospiraceae bacterium]|nr:hypothetical protein [Lachnospiraceae bacterium]